METDYKCISTNTICIMYDRFYHFGFICSQRPLHVFLIIKYVIHKNKHHKSVISKHITVLSKFR